MVGREAERAKAKFAAANIAETGQRQNAQIAQRDGVIGDGNKRDNTNHPEIAAGGGVGNGGGGGIWVGNFVERAGVGEATNWGGGGLTGGNGFGYPPSPNNSFKFQFSPSILPKFC